jgi:hypothetical protein
VQIAQEPAERKSISPGPPTGTRTRQQRKEGKLTPAQIQQLDALGFVWEASRGKSPAVSPARII